MKKKAIIISVAIIFLLVLLFPIKNQLKDGGTVEYKSLIYKVTKVHNRELESEHYDGTIIEIFNKEVFNNVVVTYIERNPPFSYEKLADMALEYFFRTTPAESLAENVSKDEYHATVVGSAIEKYQDPEMVVIEIKHSNNGVNNTLDTRYYIDIFTAKGFDDSRNEIDLNS